MKIEIEEKVYAKTFLSSIFTVKIISKKRWLFWTKYFCEWEVNYGEGINYKKAGFLYSWNIIKIDL